MSEQPKYALNDDEITLMGTIVKTWYPLPNRETDIQSYMGRVFNSEFLVRIYKDCHGRNRIEVSSEGLRDYVGIGCDIPFVDFFLRSASEQELKRIQDKGSQRTLEEAVRRARELIGK